MNLVKYKLINESVKFQNLFIILKRFKSKKAIKENSSCTRALKHYDDFYKSLFEEEWPSVRLGLLSTPKYVAVVNNFGDVEKTEEFFKSQGALNLKSYLENQKNYVEVPENEAEEGGKNKLDELITEQLCEEENRAAQFHPEGMDFKAKIDHVRQMDDENESAEDFVYKPEDARTSLKSDFTRADFDTTRLILPDSDIHKANLNEFVPATVLRGSHEYIPESQYYKYYQPKISLSVSLKDEFELDFPQDLKVYIFDRGDIKDFPDPTRSDLNIYNYLKVDGAEVLTALVLGVKPNDTVLDMCSSSGNIAYCIFQTLRPKLLLCTGDQKDNILQLFSQHLYNFSSVWNDMLVITSSSVDELECNNLFDKVLVHVPSTDDRTSLFDSEKNMFHILNTKQRLQLPEVQCQLLIQGLKLVRPGGVVLYTSSTLSPVQNDGVVSQALNTIWEEEKQDCTVLNLTPALEHTSLFFNFGDYLNMKYGTLVVPFVPVNFGPRYMCKIIKNEKINDEASDA